MSMTPDEILEAIEAMGEEEEGYHSWEGQGGQAPSWSVLPGEWDVGDGC